MKNVYRVFLLGFVMYAPLSQGALKIFYDPATDQMNDFVKAGVVRDPSYVNITESEDLGADFKKFTPKEIGLTFARHAFEQGMVDEMLIQAEKISKLIRPEDKVLFMGRTPSLLNIVLVALQESRGVAVANLIPIGFSGTPDVVNVRLNCPQNNDQARNLVTPENLEFFENYLIKRGLKDIQGKLYVVDAVGTGSNLNSFLRILVHLYTQRLHIDLPDIVFISMAHREEQSETRTTSHGEAIYKYGQKQRKIAFAGLPQYGIRKMTIDTIPLGMKSSTIIFCDFEYSQYWTAFNESFPAYRWSPEHFKSLKTTAQEESAFMFNGFVVEIVQNAMKEKIKPSEAFKRKEGWESIPELDERSY